MILFFLTPEGSFKVAPPPPPPRRYASIYRHRGGYEVGTVLVKFAARVLAKKNATGRYAFFSSIDIDIYLTCTMYSTYSPSVS